MQPSSERLVRAGERGLGLLLGVLVAALVCLLRPAMERSSGPVAYLIADRGAERLLLADADLQVLDARELPSPREIVPTGDGGAWVACASGDHLARPELLIRLDRGLGRVRQHAFHELADLSALDSGAVLAVESMPAGPARVWRVAEDLSCVQELAGASCAAGKEGRILIGCAGGELVLQEQEGCVIAWTTLRVPLVDLAPGPGEHTWWVLAGGPEERLYLLSEDLHVRWARNIDLRAEELLPVAGEERVWLADPLAGRLRRFGHGGREELAFDSFPARGSGVSLAVGSGGLLVAAPGALMVLEEAWGRAALRPIRAQGGFAELADVACVERGAALREPRR